MTGLRGRLAGSGLRPWPFFLEALDAGVGAEAGSGAAAGVGAGSACARISWAKSKS